MKIEIDTDFLTQEQKIVLGFCKGSSPALTAGWSIGDYGIVIAENTFDADSIVRLFEDDGTTCPRFELVAGGCKHNTADGDPGAYDALSNVRLIGTGVGKAGHLRALVQQETAVGDYIPRPGEIAEFRDHDAGVWYVDVFDGRSENTNWEQCRPLSNPLVLQFREHVPGEPMPCESGKRVLVLFRDGSVIAGRALGQEWAYDKDDPDTDVIGWLPVGQRA